MTTVGVTGATGELGGAVARLLAGSGVEPVLVARSPERVAAVPGAQVRGFGGYDDRAGAEHAFAGIDTLLLVSAAESADRLAQHRTVVDAAAAAGVHHVVYTSFLGAAPDCVFTLGRDHWATEEHLRASGVATTFLRDNFYLDVLPLMVGEDDVLRGPAGDGRLAGVARADVAACAAAVLRDPEPHAGATYDLTGPEALTLEEVAAVLAEHRARPVRFHDETVAEAYASRSSYDAPDWQLDAWVSTYTAIAAGEMAAVTADVERLTGRAPRSLAQLLGEQGASER